MLGGKVGTGTEENDRPKEKHLKRQGMIIDQDELLLINFTWNGNGVGLFLFTKTNPTHDII